VGVAHLFHHLHREEFIRVDLVQPDADTHRQSRPQVQRPPKQLAGVGQLRGVQSIQRAVIAALVLFLGRVRAEARGAKLLAPQRPVNQVRQRRRLGPLADYWGLQNTVTKGIGRTVPGSAGVSRNVT